MGYRYECSDHSITQSPLHSSQSNTTTYSSREKNAKRVSFSTKPPILYVYEVPGVEDCDTTISKSRAAAARLALILHAGLCMDMECRVRNCDVAKNLIQHCQECKPQDSCKNISCKNAHLLLNHFRVCNSKSNKTKKCLMCNFIKTEHRWLMDPIKQNASSDGLFSPTVPDIQGHPSNN